MNVGGRKRGCRAALYMAAALLLCAGPVPAGAANTMLGNALGKPGGNALLRADEIDYDINNALVIAHGHVEIDYNGRILMAEQVTYDQNKDVVTASGHVTVMAPNGDVAFADHVVLTDQMRDGILSGFYALIGKSGRLGAASAQRTNQNTTVANRAVYTPCKICRQTGDRTPLWQVRSYRVIYREQKHRIYFHDATIEAFGVPVFYTPFFSTPDPTVKHQTGILAPDIGSSSILGSLIQLPFYIAFSDSQDATLAALFSTEAGQMLSGEYRQRWQQGGMWLQASIAHNPNGGFSGHQEEWYSDLFGSGRIFLTDHFEVGYDAQLTSDDTFLKRYDISSLDRLTSDLFFQDEWGRSRLAVTGYFFQGLRATDSNKLIPLALPIVQFTYIPLHDWMGGQFRFDFNGSSITRNLGPDTQRMTAEARWRRPFVTPDGQLITFQLDARGDIYRIQNNDLADFAAIPAKTNYIERGLPYVALDWRWPLISGTRASDSIIVEPIAQVIAAPYGGNPPGIPNEDSADFEFSDTNLLAFDRFPGYDLWESGPRANVGLHGVAYFPSGSIDALLGEVYRLKPDPIFQETTGLNGDVSDIVSLVTVKFPPYIEMANRLDIDNATGSVRRNEVYLQASYGRSSVEVSYVHLPPQTDQGLPSSLTGLDTPREEVTAQAIVGLFDHWSLYAAGQRDLEASQLLESDFGIGYDDECLGFSVSYRRVYSADRDIPASSSVIVHLIPKFGNEPEDLLDLFPHQIFTQP